MTVVTEGNDSFYLSTPGILIDDEFETASAWASKLIEPNKAFKYILGNYVEADNPNRNGQYWEISGLRMALPSITGSPLNINHHRNEIVGHLVGGELLYPTTETSSSIVNPYIETLGVLYRAYFPEMLKTIESAFNTGKLYFSQECVGSHITCVGEQGCGEQFAYKGPFDKSYCEHINRRQSYRQIDNPHFVGAALIMPGNSPGWAAADITEIANDYGDSALHAIISDIEEENPHLSSAEHESLMWDLLMQSVIAERTNKS